MTNIGGRAIRCVRCKITTTAHSSFLVDGPTHWCLNCQASLPYEEWIFVYEPGCGTTDVSRRGCAARGPSTLGTSDGLSRLVPPMCALDEGHEGDHEDDITRDRWT